MSWFRLDDVDTYADLRAKWPEGTSFTYLGRQAIVVGYVPFSEFSSVDFGAHVDYADDMGKIHRIVFKRPMITALLGTP